MTELSICIPTLDRRNGLADRLIASIQVHTAHIDHEVVVVDCGGRVRGYTAPQNEAMAQARGEFLLAINDDVEIFEGWIDPLLTAARAGAWCTTPDESQNGPALLFAPHCMLWRAEAWRQIGGLDERFIHHASDIDIARRLIDAGHPPVQVKLPRSPIHAFGSSAQPELGEVCKADLDRYAEKWSVTAEFDKHRLGAVVRGEQQP